MYWANCGEWVGRGEGFGSRIVDGFDWVVDTLHFQEWQTTTCLHGKNKYQVGYIIVLPYAFMSKMGVRYVVFFNCWIGLRIVPFSIQL